MLLGSFFEGHGKRWSIYYFARRIDFIHMEQAIINPAKGSFVDLLERHGLRPVLSDLYIRCGGLPEGPCLYVSVIPTRFRELFESVLPLLVSQGIAFAVVKDEATMFGVNNGFFGEDKIGKLLIIGARFLPWLKEVTDPFYGPEIINTFKINQALYADAPFAGSSAKPIASESRDLGGKFLPIQLLKSDVKTDVFKALEFSRWLVPRWRVVKRARKYRYYDEQNRDIGDIFRWQVKVYRDLKDVLPTPEIKEPFEDGGFVFLPMSFVSGERLTDWVKAKMGMIPWYRQPATVRQEVISVLVQILGYIAAIHEKGYVHRDIQGSNFLIGKNGRVTLIDLEMLYHIGEGVPAPPFGFGTPGYVSPQQFNHQLPDQADDIYAIGALLARVFTGIEPGRMMGNQAEVIYFFTGDKELSSVVGACFSESRGGRPGDHAILQVVSRLGEGSAPDGNIHTSLLNLIQAFIRTGDDLIIDAPWYSLANGVTGVIWVLAEARKQGFDIQPCVETVNRWLESLNQGIFRQNSPIPPGLYEGSAGITMMLSACLEAGILQDSPVVRGLIRQWLFREAGTLDLANGRAGQGIACLRCLTYLDPLEATRFLRGICKDVLERWNKRDANELAYFLLSYAGVYSDPAAIKTALKGLTDHGDGFEMAILYLKAYEITHDAIHREVAEQILKAYPPEIAMEDLSLKTGLPGLGCAYLEAFRILGDRQWIERAAYIVRLFDVLRPGPNAGLLSGNGGVLYFLIQFNACYLSS